MSNETLQEKFNRLQFSDWDKPEILDEVLTTIKEIGACNKSFQNGDENHFMILFELDSLVKEKAPDIWADVHKDDGVIELYKQLEDGKDGDM
jgi:hypothetical protein